MFLLARLLCPPRSVQAICVSHLRVFCVVFFWLGLLMPNKSCKWVCEEEKRLMAKMFMKRFVLGTHEVSEYHIGFITITTDRRSHLDCRRSRSYKVKVRAMVAKSTTFINKGVSACVWLSNDEIFKFLDSAAHSFGPNVVKEIAVELFRNLSCVSVTRC